jgi:hypothetical protein
VRQKIMSPTCSTDIPRMKTEPVRMVFRFKVFCKAIVVVKLRSPAAGRLMTGRGGKNVAFSVFKTQFPRCFQLNARHPTASYR